MTARAFISVFLALAACLLCCDAAASGDTGTYEILDYRVKLTPKSDGTVETAYYQKWRVTGGHIPWITVGTPNGRYRIVDGSAGGNAKRLSSANSGGWSGVRVDLDKDYKPNETFEVRFTVIQSGIIYGRQQKCVLDFVPGWYDRAETDRLTVQMTCFTDLDGISADPEPTRTEGRTMTWERRGLRRGERFHIAVTFPRDVFDKDVGETGSGRQPRVPSSSSYGQEDDWEKKPESCGGAGAGVAIVLFVVLVIAVLAVQIARMKAAGSDYNDDGGGGIFFSGFGSGLGGGSGCVSTCACACACVSCACACACAGGGGAGCDRKLTHACPLCRQCPTKDTCPLWSTA